MGMAARAWGRAVGGVVYPGPGAMGSQATPGWVISGLFGVHYTGALGEIF